MSEIYNIDLCPECESELTITATINDTEEDSPGPLQGHWLHCTDCDHETVVAIIHYPDGEYEGITEAVDESCDECGEEATKRVKRNTGREQFFCDDCIFDLFQQVYKEVVIRLNEIRP